LRHRESCFRDAPGDLKPAELWHANIGDKEIWVHALSQHQGRFAVRRFGEYFTLNRRFDQIAQAAAHDWMVIGKD
jgi:hypothetical protein